MSNLTTYYNQLLQQIETYLKKEYNSLGNVNFEQFDKVNFYLIDKALNKNQNLHIKTIQKTEKANFYVPIVISTAISLFFKNYCDSDIVYKIGDVLQKAGRRYKITGFNNGKYKLEFTISGVTTVAECTEQQIKKYDIVTGNVSNRRVKVRLDDYKKLFKGIFGTENFPTNFKYKTAIILDWNDFQAELKEHKTADLDLLKSIPMQRINKNGGEYDCTLPIDPMIYIIPNYYVFQDFVKDKYEVDSLILIGRNKYNSDYLEALANDIYNEEIKKTIIVGNEEFQDNTETFIKWNWTQPEISFLKEEPIAILKSEQVEDDDFIKAIEDYYKYIKDFEQKYFTRLSDLIRFKKLLYNLVLPNENSRLINYQEWVKDLMLKETENAIKDVLIGQNENYFEQLSETEKLIEKIFSSFANTKLNFIKKQQNIEILIVPKRNLDIWQKDFQHQSLKIMSLSQFVKKQPDFQKEKKVLLLSIFGYEYSPHDLIEQLSSFPHSYSFISYKEEITALEEIKNRWSNIYSKEYCSINRKKLTGLDFNFEERPENISDLIENLAERAERGRKQYDYESLENVNYALTFEENSDELIFDGCKSVLLHLENRKEKIFNLMVGDKVRIYTNYTKERLYEIALAEDSASRFSEIDRLANLWKDCLKQYFQTKQLTNPKYNESDLLSELNKCGLKVKSTLTIYNWLFKERDKFPSSENSLLSIKQLINCSVLNCNFKQVIEARRLYRGIMLSLGRNLSEEVMDYVLSNKNIKGKILQTFTDSEVLTFVDKSLPLLTIKTKTKTEEEET